MDKDLEGLIEMSSSKRPGAARATPVLAMPVPPPPATSAKPVPAPLPPPNPMPAPAPMPVRVDTAVLPAMQAVTGLQADEPNQPLFTFFLKPLPVQGAGADALGGQSPSSISVTTPATSPLPTPTQPPAASVPAQTAIALPPVPVAPAAPPAPVNPALPVIPAAPPVTPVAAAPGPILATVSPALEHKSQDLLESEEIRNKVSQEVLAMKRRLGILVLEDPNAGEPGNVAQRAMYACKYIPQELITYPIELLLEFEAALTAHQVWVQSMENEWTAQYEMLGNEISRFKETRREGTAGDRVKLKEFQILSHPQIRPINHRFIVAKAVSKLLEGMGRVFSQMEDGLKRAIDNARDERIHNHKQAAHQ